LARKYDVEIAKINTVTLTPTSMYLLPTCTNLFGGVQKVGLSETDPDLRNLELYGHFPREFLESEEKSNITRFRSVFSRKIFSCSYVTGAIVVISIFGGKNCIFREISCYGTYWA
jgi:hypothetical protein